MNLLDFELPPAPTPRSVPTITVRELESLKSSYLSQISSLKATLSGREAEVDSLKKAVSDAERRAGEAQESLSEERCKREHAEQEIAGWKKRGQEFEVVLKSVKEEVLKSDAEREDLNRRLEDTDRRAADAEARAVRAEERFAEALSARAAGESGDSDAVEEQVQRLVSAQIDAKIESVSRELHAVYKEKHERKVATLKKSYEARNEKKTAELLFRVAELEKANDELQVARDATFSGPVNDSMIAKADTVELKSQIEEQKAQLARLESEMQTSRQQQEQLVRELQQERIEKGDLVAAVDEMLALQSEAAPPSTPAGARAMSVVEDFRKSISRPPSGLRAPASSGIPAAPGGGESRIGRSIPTPGALNRSASGASGKSRMLANIERMGRAGSSNGHRDGGE
jgi:chromosome segregation ATPase